MPAASAAAEDARTGVALVTGFLGAGKTTLLNRLLKDPSVTDTAIIVNEFGEISLDHLLVEQATDGMIELADGCLCCTVRGALVDTLLDLADAGRKLKRVIVETTGLADPVPVLQALATHAGLIRAYRLDAVLTLIDALNGRQTLEDHEEARSQVAVADRLLVTKSDLADDGERTSLLLHLRASNPLAPITEAREPASAALLAPVRPAEISAKAMPVHHHDHGHHHDHHHGPGHEFTSISLEHRTAIPRKALENFLDLLRAELGNKILRIKGLVETTEDPERPLVVQGAQRALHPLEPLAQWPEAMRGERGVQLVVIGKQLDADYIQRLFAAFIGQVAVDTPDRAALEENPLAISGFRF